MRPEPDQEIPPVRILLADDNPDSGESLRTLLQFRGHDVHLVHDGLAAAEAAARLQPDVIILDIGMPGLNGYDAARRIREQQGERRPVLVALTGWSQDEYRRRSAQAGFDAHVVKPVTDTVLLQVISQVQRQ
jgi:CheY-like chemotaxis protein